MGVVNLNPGLMRFYRWSSDFSTQAHTHSQIWVRFLHLPQEYWRKHTLLEIASGVGTPLIIDVITLYRHLGKYARVLIDVDLSEQLFESGIVERKGHALSVMVQYERQPSFCTHCKMLGHEVHSCIKLSSLNTTKGTSKALKAETGQHQAKTLPKHNGKGKKPVMTADYRSVATVIQFVSKSAAIPISNLTWWTWTILI